MITLLLVFLFVLFSLTFIAAAGGGGLVRVHKNEEWTKFKNGVPVCGVGRRGYWTNSHTFGGDWPFRERPDGTWYDPKTGKDCVTMSLNDLLKKHEKKDKS
jgi:hypothetical protein